MKKARMLSLFIAILVIAAVAIPMMANAQQPAPAASCPTCPPTPPADPPKPTLEGLAAATSVNSQALTDAKKALEKNLKGKASKAEVAKIRRDLTRIGEAEKRIKALEDSRKEAELAADKAKAEAEITKAEAEVIKDLANSLEDETAAATIQAYLDRKASDGRVAVRGALEKDCPKGWAIGKLSVKGNSLVLRCRPATSRVYESFSSEKESDVIKAQSHVHAELAEKTEARASASFGAVLGRGLVGGVLIGTGAGVYSAMQANPGHRLQDGLLNAALWGVVGTGVTMAVDVAGRAAGLWK